MSKQITNSDNKHLNLPKRIEIAVADRDQIYFRYNACGRKLGKQNQTNQSISANNWSLIEKLSFDPCSVTPGFGECAQPNPLVVPIPPGNWKREGKSRNANDWTFTNVPTTFLFDRGFTGHEHLDKFNLINMLSEAKSRSEAFAGNGRVYDLFVARFLSPDPFVQTPDYTQGYNRYSYGLNNPVKYTDPSGYNNHPVWIDNIVCWEAWGLVSGFGGGGSSGGGGWSSSSIMPGSGNHWSDQYRTGNENTYFAWANLHNNNVTKTAYGDFLQSNGEFLLDGSAVITHKDMSGSWYADYLNGKNNYLRNDLEGLAWDAGRGNTYIGLSFDDQTEGEFSDGGDDLLLHSTYTYIYDSHRYFTDKIYMIEAGQHVKVELTNMNILGVQLGFQDITTYTYEKCFFGLINKKVYTGDSYSMVLLPGQSQSFDFYRWDYTPKDWWFQIGTSISQAANVRLSFYSDWIPSTGP